MPRKAAQQIQDQETENKPAIKNTFTSGTGRRKTAVARIFLYPEKGEFTINDKPINDLYSTEKDKLKWMKPFHILGISHPTAQFRGSIKVEGSGRSSQISAIAHSISRALAALNEDYAKLLRKQGMLTRDSRMVERKKYFLRKARKAPQYSKR